MLLLLPVTWKGDISTYCVSSADGCSSTPPRSRCTVLDPKPCGSVLPCPALCPETCHWASCAEGSTANEGQPAWLCWGPPGAASQSITQLTARGTVSTALAGKAAISYLPACVSHHRTAQGCQERAGAGGAPGANPWPQGGSEQLPGFLSLLAGAVLGCALARLAALRAAYLHGQWPAEEVGSVSGGKGLLRGAGRASRAAQRAKMSGMSALRCRAELSRSRRASSHLCLSPICATVSVQPRSEFSAVFPTLNSRAGWGIFLCSEQTCRHMQRVQAALMAPREGLPPPVVPWRAHGRGVGRAVQVM